MPKGVSTDSLNGQIDIGDPAVHIPSIILRNLSWITIKVRRWMANDTTGNNQLSVLVLGVYLSDRENAIEHIVHTLAESKQFIVDQKWISLLGAPPSSEVALVTVRRRFGRMAKFTLLNYLLATTAWRLYDYVILCDDDILLPNGFIDRFISFQKQFNFALAQPARTHNSYIDHPITEQVDSMLARETRFVEIGPLTSIRADMMRIIAPFDETAPMGWGLDFVWPYIASEHNLKLGIIDATPVDHSMRAPVTAYDGTSTRHRMQHYLNSHRHLSKEEAFTTIIQHPIQK